MEAIMDLAIFLYLLIIYLCFNEVYLIYKNLEKKQYLSRNHLFEHIVILVIQGFLKMWIIVFILTRVPMEMLVNLQVYIPLLMATLWSFLSVQHFKKERIENF